MRVPILSRLGPLDYLRILLTWTFFIIERFIRGIFALVPFTSVMDWLRFKTIGRAPRLFRGFQDEPIHPIANMVHIADMVDFNGYPLQEHIVRTVDGWLLGVHRIPAGRGLPHEEKEIDEDEKEALKQLLHGVDNDTASQSDGMDRPRPAVLLWHGFMMNSEVWVAHPERKKVLAYQLADLGYDVWLGNVRGNKYSCKHTTYRPSDLAFWDFCLDDFAMIDIPAVVDYILACTDLPSLTYIGFSQGTGICFAGLSMSPSLNQKINRFIALAPATKPRGLDSTLIDSFARSSPDLIYLLLGRRQLLSSSLFWQELLSTGTFVTVIDACVRFLFGWRSGNNSNATKKCVYRHLYSYASVKTMVHWFQIIGSGRFAMYDDTPNFSVVPSANAATHKGAGNTRGHVAPAYPCTQISTPVAIFWGAKDGLCDIPYLLEQTKQAAIYVECVDHYEHLCFLWADDIDTRVHPKVISLVGEAAEELGFEVLDGRVVGLAALDSDEEDDFDDAIDDGFYDGGSSIAESMDTASQGSIDGDMLARALRYRSRRSTSVSVSPSVIGRRYRRMNERKAVRSARALAAASSRRASVLTKALSRKQKEEEENDRGHTQTLTGDIAPCATTHREARSPSSPTPPAATSTTKTQRSTSPSSRHSPHFAAAEPFPQGLSSSSLPKPSAASMRDAWPMNEKESKRQRALSQRRLRTATQNSSHHAVHRHSSPPFPADTATTEESLTHHGDVHDDITRARDEKES